MKSQLSEVTNRLNVKWNLFAKQRMWISMERNSETQPPKRRWQSAGDSYGKLFFSDFFFCVFLQHYVLILFFIFFRVFLSSTIGEADSYWNFFFPPENLLLFVNVCVCHPRITSLSLARPVLYYIIKVYIRNDYAEKFCSSIGRRLRSSKSSLRGALNDPCRVCECRAATKMSSLRSNAVVCAGAAPK